MQWCFLLIWAQGLRQAPLVVSGDVTGRIVTAGNISAEEGGSATLQCHLVSTTAQVTQVSWEHRDQLVATYHTNHGWHVFPDFQERVVPGSRLDLTLLSLTTNDTGEYFCIFYTYPDGIYKERLFLEVGQHSGAEHSPGFQLPLLGAMAAVLLVICIAVPVVLVLVRKSQCLQIRSVQSGLRRRSSEQEEGSPHVILPHPGSCAPGGLYAEHGGEAYNESCDYFNVLSYRSFGNFCVQEETG